MAMTQYGNDPYCCIPITHVVSFPVLKHTIIILALLNPYSYFVHAKEFIFTYSVYSWKQKNIDHLF